MVLVIIVLLTGCRFANKYVNIGPMAQIDWIDFVMFNDIQYEGTWNNNKNLEGIKLGEEYEIVQFKLSDVVGNPSYKIKNGDSAYHEIGTKVYEIEGYKPSFRVAIKTSEGIRIYEATHNSNASIGEDLLDIKSKVIMITLNSESNGKTQLGIIEEKSEIEEIVEGIMESTIDESIERNYENRYFIEFHLDDGTSVTRNFLPKSNLIGYGILISEELKDEILKYVGE